MQAVAKRVVEGAFVIVATALLGVGIWTALAVGKATAPKLTVAALGGFGLVAGAYLTGAAANQLKQSNTSPPDHVQQALEKAAFDDRSAAGTVGDVDVLVEASLSDHDHPRLTVLAGGEWHASQSNEKFAGEYTGGRSVRHGFDTVDELLEQYDALVDRYDLTPVEEAQEGDG